MENRILQHLRNEHQNINGLLCVLSRQLEGIRAADKPDYFLMHEITDYLTYYSDHYHHPYEDLIYARLVEKKPELRTIVDRVEQQHRQIAIKGASIRDLLSGITQGSVFSRDILTSTGSDYIDTYRRHMQCEEERLFIEVSNTLNSADWMVLVSSFQWRRDPVFSDEVSTEYQYLKRHITGTGAGEWPWHGLSLHACQACSTM